MKPADINLQFGCLRSSEGQEVTFAKCQNKSSKSDERVRCERGLQQPWSLLSLSLGGGQTSGGAARCPRSPSTLIAGADWLTAQGCHRSKGRRFCRTGRPTAALPHHTHTRLAAGRRCNTQTGVINPSTGTVSQHWSTRDHPRV